MSQIAKRQILSLLALVTAASALLLAAYPAALNQSVRARSRSDDERSFTITDSVNLVLLDVSVKDRNGGYVTGLNRGSFRVFEDGAERPIAHFSVVDTPVTVGLVVDNSGSMRLKRPEVVTAGLAFARESNPQDDFFVVNFNNRIIRGLPKGMAFTDDLPELRAALFYGSPEGQTALYDAVAYSLRHLELSRRDKRTLIVVSDGGDNVSETKFAKLIQMIESSRATIYVIGLYDEADSELNVPVLKRIASVSGGEFFEPKKLSDIVPVFDRISKDIRNCYSIGYKPDETNDKRVLRSVRVVAQVEGRKLLVRTRTKYSMQPLDPPLAGQTNGEVAGRSAR